MTQLTFGDAEYAGKRKQTRREVFLAEMDRVVPWAAWLALIEPHYPKPGRPGRQPYALKTMLRIHFLQQWYALSDPAMEEALYEIASLRQFAQLSLLDAIPDETTLHHFRHLLERHGLAAKLLVAVNDDLTRRGLLLRQGPMAGQSFTRAAFGYPGIGRRGLEACPGDSLDQNLSTLEGQSGILVDVHPAPWCRL